MYTLSDSLMMMMMMKLTVMMVMMSITVTHYFQRLRLPPPPSVMNTSRFWGRWRASHTVDLWALHTDRQTDIHRDTQTDTETHWDRQTYTSDNYRRQRHAGHVTFSVTEANPLLGCCVLISNTCSLDSRHVAASLFISMSLRSNSRQHTFNHTHSVTTACFQHHHHRHVHFRQDK